MKTIYKYPLELKTSQRIYINKGGKILSVQSQNNRPCIWAEVETENKKKGVDVFIFGTGYPIETDLSVLKYIGTIQLEGGVLVFHVYIKRHG